MCFFFLKLKHYFWQKEHIHSWNKMSTYALNEAEHGQEERDETEGTHIYIDRYINVYDFLEQGRDGAKRVPQNRC